MVLFGPSLDEDHSDHTKKIYNLSVPTAAMGREIAIILTKDNSYPDQSQSVRIIDLNAGNPQSARDGYHDNINHHVSEDHWQKVANPKVIQSVEQPLSELLPVRFNTLGMMTKDILLRLKKELYLHRRRSIVSM